MSDIDRFASTWTPRMLSILRIVAALLFVEHGTSKLLAFPHNPAFDHLPPLLWAAGILELFGGSLVVLGLFTRPVAFLLSGEMAIGYFMVHFPHAFLPLHNGGEAAILFCFVFLFLAVAGGGAWGVDVLRRSGEAKMRTG